MSLKTIMLSPVLLAQALWVITRAVRLPEPGGPREGQTGEGPELDLLVIGDSSAAGVGTVHQDDALIGRLVAQLAASHRVAWSLSARSGATSASALRFLDDLPARQFDAAFISLGVNDTKNGVSLRVFRRNYDQLLDRLQTEFGVTRLYLSGLPPIRHFPLLPWPLNTVLGDRAARFDTALHQIAEARRDTRFLPLNVPLDPAGMAEDGFHPGPAIYASWAAGIATAIREDFTR